MTHKITIKQQDLPQLILPGYEESLGLPPGLGRLPSGDGFLIGDPKFSHLVSSSGLILPEDYVRDLGLGEHGHVVVDLNYRLI